MKSLEIPRSNIKETQTENSLTKKEFLPAPEMAESKIFAKEKLKKLKDPEFREFAIRFMNKDEYQDMMQKGQLYGREAYVFNEENKNAVVFSDYLQENKGDWRSAICRQTAWAHSSADLDVADDFLKLLKDTHQKQSQEIGVDKKDIRKKTLTAFRNDLIRYLYRESHGGAYTNGSKAGLAYLDADFLRGNERELCIFKTLYECESPKQYYQELENFVNRGLVVKEESGSKRVLEFRVGASGGYLIDSIDQKSDESSKESAENFNNLKNNYLKPYFEQFAKEVSERQSILKKKYDDQYEKIEILKKFAEDPEWIYKDKKNLRELFNALTYIKTRGMKQAESQYHMGVIIELPAILKGRIEEGSYYETWGNIKTKGDENFDQKKHILGAIALMPDKKLVDLAKSLSSKAGSLSHPIFDKNGQESWPKE